MIRVRSRVLVISNQSLPLQVPNRCLWIAIVVRQNHAVTQYKSAPLFNRWSRQVLRIRKRVGYIHGFAIVRQWISFLYHLLFTRRHAPTVTPAVRREVFRINDELIFFFLYSLTNGFLSPLLFFFQVWITSFDWLETKNQRKNTVCILQVLFFSRFEPPIRTNQSLTLLIYLFRLLFYV